MSENNPFAWSGLLKWSLAHTDTSSNNNANINNEASEPPAPMSDDDIKFLETVMKEGLVDETTSIREILKSFIDFLENDEKKEEEEDKMIDSLWELRDLIGLIDYSKVFVTMGGLPFLLGCIKQQESISIEIRGVCLVLLATLAQNNPDVQNVLLSQEHNTVDTLIRLFFQEESSSSIKGRVVQALSCIVRGSSVEEEICFNNDFLALMKAGLGCSSTLNNEMEIPAENIRKRCIFLLQALLCSDSTSYSRIQQFEPCIHQIVKKYSNIEFDESLEIREMSQNLVLTLLQQKVNIKVLFDEKSVVLNIANLRIASIDNLADDEEEKDRVSVEYENWRKITQEISQLHPNSPGVLAPSMNQSNDSSNPPVLMLTGRPANDTGETLPQ